METLAVSMIFPGMDPYLEHPATWPGVHRAMVVYLSDALQPRLDPRYVATIRERVFEGPRCDVLFKRSRSDVGRGGVAVLEGDVPVLVRVSVEEIHESHIAIVDLQSEQRVVTVIEVVSPTNKYAGPG